MTAQIRRFPPVLVVGRQRSGTSVFRRFLASSGQYTDLGEVLNNRFLLPPGEARPGKPKFFEFLHGKVRADHRYLYPTLWPAAFDEFFAAICAGRDEGVILDCKYNLLPLIAAPATRPGEYAPYILRFAARQGAHIVHVTRANALHAILSERIAMTTRQWSATSAAELKSAAVRIDPDSIVALIAAELETVDRVRRLLAAFSKVVDVEYAEMFDARGDFSEDFSRAMESRFGLAGLSRQPALVRQNRAPLSEAIANYDEVREALAASPYHWMLGAASADDTLLRIRAATPSRGASHTSE